MNSQMLLMSMLVSHALVDFFVLSFVLPCAYMLMSLVKTRLNMLMSSVRTRLKRNYQN